MSRKDVCARQCGQIEAIMEIVAVVVYLFWFSIRFNRRSCRCASYSEPGKCNCTFAGSDYAPSSARVLLVPRKRARGRDLLREAGSQLTMSSGSFQKRRSRFLEQKPRRELRSSGPRGAAGH